MNGPDVDLLLASLWPQAEDHALLLFGTDERIGWASAGATSILATSAGALHGLPAERLFTPRDRELGVPAQEFSIARLRGRSDDDRWSCRPDGSTFYAMGITYGLRDARGALIGYAKIFQNRSDWMQQVETLRNLDQRKEVTIATLAHELRSPLAPLANVAMLLRRGAPAHEMADIVQRQVALMRRLVDEVLEPTLARVGKVRLERARIDLQAIVEGACETIRPLADARGQHVELLGASPSPAVDGDAVRLHQVFVNLMTNAVKFTPDDGQIWVTIVREDRDAVVKVEDTGQGIAPDMLERIFELFTQADAAGTGDETVARIGEGLGIGLALVKELVSLHGGSVQARSDGRGRGSEFVVRLPQVVVDPAR